MDGELQARSLQGREADIPDGAVSEFLFAARAAVGGQAPREGPQEDLKCSLAYTLCEQWLLKYTVVEVLPFPQE